MILLHTEKLQALAPEQHGSHLDHVTIYQSLNMQLTYNLVWQQCLMAATCSNHMKVCYGRILVHAFACLALLCLGIPINPIAVLMFGTNPALTTLYLYGFWWLRQSFTGMLLGTPLQGAGQENCTSPQIWATVSSPFLYGPQIGQWYHPTIPSYQGPSEIYWIWICGWCGLVVSNQKHNSSTPSHTCKIYKPPWICGKWDYEYQVEHFQPKSQWTFNDFKWKNGQWCYKSKDKFPRQLFMNDVSGKCLPLEPLEVWEAEHCSWDLHCPWW